MCLTLDLEATKKFIAEWKDGEVKTFWKLVNRQKDGTFITPFIGCGSIKALIGQPGLSIT